MGSTETTVDLNKNHFRDILTIDTMLQHSSAIQKEIRMKGLDYTALTLVIIGAINWGLIGLFRLDLVSLLLEI